MTKFRHTERSDIEVENFKVLIKKMYKNIPNGYYINIVEQTITDKWMIENLVETQFFFRSPPSGGSFPAYALGPAAFPLVSAWETERLTKSIQLLTYVLIVIGFLTLFVGVFALFLQ